MSGSPLALLQPSLIRVDHHEEGPHILSGYIGPPATNINEGILVLRFGSLSFAIVPLLVRAVRTRGVGFRFNHFYLSKTTWFPTRIFHHPPLGSPVTP